jgi:hypothetical protein
MITVYAVRRRKGCRKSRQPRSLGSIRTRMRRAMTSLRSSPVPMRAMNCTKR